MFRTEVKVVPTNLNLTLQDNILTIGSCFADVIGNKLQENKVPALVNPFGTIFNPVSVAMLLQAAAGNPHDLEQSLVQRDDIWYNYNLHSSISSPNKADLLALIEQRIAQTSEQLKKTKLLILTLGTAVAYKLEETGAIVANCHKLPAKLFHKQLLSPELITQALATAFDNMKEVNPALQIVLTVSPVRHIKETLQLNSVSKAVLRVVCYSLSESNDYIHYFPAFELMTDDLRDYRFYGADMLHPTPVAEDYIWDKFVTAFYQPSFQEFTQEWAKIKRAIAHKPFHPDTTAHQTFIKNTLQQLDMLADKYSLDVTDDRNKLLQQSTN